MTRLPDLGNEGENGRENETRANICKTTRIIRENSSGAVGCKHSHLENKIPKCVGERNVARREASPGGLFPPPGAS